MTDEQPISPPNLEPPLPEPTVAAPVRGTGIVTRMLIACGVVLFVLVAGTFASAALDSSDREPRSAGQASPGRAGPLIGDHWHALYSVYIGDERQPNMPTWQSGIHTHDDGIIHMHPFQAFEEGSGASLAKFFDYGGGVLTETEIHIPGFSETYQDGDQVPGVNSEGHIYIAAVAAAESQQKEDLGDGWALVSPDHVPPDGDRILIFFSTEEQMRNIVASGGETEPPRTIPPANLVLTP